MRNTFSLALVVSAMLMTGAAFAQTAPAPADAAKPAAEAQKAPAPAVTAPSGEWATGTPVQKGQTRRHPGTGQPLTEQAYSALLEALRRRVTTRE